MNFKSLIPTLLPLATVIGAAVAPAVQHFLATHAVASTIVVALYSVVTHWIPSPALN